jgi:hypothetical protein
VAFFSVIGRILQNMESCQVMNKLLLLAFVLLVAWVVLRLVLAVTGAFLHILWIVALVLVVLWLLGKLKGK